MGCRETGLPVQFGEIDIDSELVASVQRLDGKEEQRIMMLNNGCLCCTVREDLVGMLNELVRWWDATDAAIQCIMPRQPESDSLLQATSYISCPHVAHGMLVCLPWPGNIRMAFRLHLMIQRVVLVNPLLPPPVSHMSI